jgi:hypothetical protein
MFPVLTISHFCYRYVSDNFPKVVTFEDCSGALKGVADNWNSLTDDEKAVR